MPIRFVYFDAGFTLLHPHPSAGYHYARIAEKYGVRVDQNLIAGAFRPAWRQALARQSAATLLPYGRNLDEARLFWRGVIHACFEVAQVPPPNDPAYFSEVFDYFAQAECWRLYPDVEPALAMLEDRGIPYGVISNWDPRLRSVLEGIGLSGRLSSIILSCEAGYEKPRPEIYAAAQLAAGVPAEEIALIGDEPEADGHGALRAGWQQCLVDRSAAATPRADELRARNNLPDCLALILAP